MKYFLILFFALGIFLHANSQTFPEEREPVCISKPEHLEFYSPGEVQCIKMKGKSAVFPADLSSFSELKKLSFQNNKKLRIPEELDPLFSLEELHLSNVGLTRFPEEVLALENLRLLDLSQNPIEFLPEDLVKLQNLEVLELWSTKIDYLPDFCIDFLPHHRHVEMGRRLARSTWIS